MTVSRPQMLGFVRMSLCVLATRCRTRVCERECVYVCMCVCVGGWVDGWVGGSWFREGVSVRACDLVTCLSASM
jgi:hypothetical protein